MSAKRFSKKEAFRFGLINMKENIGFFIGLLIVVTLVYLIPNGIQNALMASLPVVAAVIGLIAWFIQRMVDLGLVKIALKFCDGQRGTIADLVLGIVTVFKYILSTIIYMVIVLVGFVLLIIPGIIFAIRLQFYGYLIIDKGAGPVEALSRSWAVTKGVAFELFVFGILAALINLAGALAFFVGLFASVPIVLLAYAYVYRALLKEESVPAGA